MQKNISYYKLKLLIDDYFSQFKESYKNRKISEEDLEELKDILDKYK